MAKDIFSKKDFKKFGGGHIKHEDIIRKPKEEPIRDEEERLDNFMENEIIREKKEIFKEEPEVKKN